MLFKYPTQGTKKVVDDFNRLATPELREYLGVDSSLSIEDLFMKQEEIIRSRKEERFIALWDRILNP